MTAIRVNYAERKIVLSSAFAKKAFTHGTDEYRQLQAVRNDYPDFALKMRKFKTNTAQERYRGLTYDFMREHIRTHEADPKPVLADLEDMIGISKCHSIGKRYPTMYRRMTASVTLSTSLMASCSLHQRSKRRSACS